MDRLPNYQNFQKLWDFYTGEGGLSPVATAGLLGNVYAESRGNPAAVNPQDGRDGSDSIGIFQANSTRADALRNFASQRGTVADDLMTQAAYHLYEGTQGPERRGFQQGLDATTPEDSALGFASGFIRPAAQHIPQRAEYGRMMYDIFAGGNPNGVQAGLAFNPQQAERLSREDEAMNNGTSPNVPLSYGKAAPQGNSTQDIVMRLFELANGGMGAEPQAMMQAPQPPMAGPRPINADPYQNEALPNVGGGEDGPLLRTAPRMEDVESQYKMPDIDQSINEMFPAAEGEQPTSEVIASSIGPIAQASAYNLGVPVEDAPTTASEIAEALTGPPPAANDDSPEAKKTNNRRMLAADMLEVLSAGLGQMSVGAAVNVAPQLQGQRERYAAQDAQRQQQEQQQRQAQTLAQELIGMNMPEMARVAVSGPDGYAQALQTIGTVAGRAPATRDGFAALTQPQRAEVLRGAGFSEEEVTFFSQAGLEDLAADAIKAQTLPDPEREAREAAAAAEQGGVDREIGALAGIASQFRENPAVLAAAKSAFANPNQANASNLRDALAEAGVNEAELAATAAKAPLPLSEGEAAFYSGVASPEQMELAKQDARLAEQIRNAGGEGLEKGAIAQAQQDVEAQIPPERIRFLRELAQDEEAMRTELRLRSAEAGTDGFNDVQTIMATNLLDAQKTKINNLTTREPMVNAMRDLVTLLSDPSVDRSDGGPLTAAITGLTNIGNQLGLPMGAQEPIENYMARIMESYTGEFFQNFRLEGSGATSDMEAKNYMNAMPNIRDDNLKRLGLAQRIIRMNERDGLAVQLEQEWVNMHSDDPDKLLDPRARAEFIRDGVAAEAKELYPVVDRGSDGWIDKVESSIASGNIAAETVIRYVSPDGEPRYVMFGDLARELGLEL